VDGRVGAQDHPFGVVPAEGAATQLPEPQGAVEGAGRDVQVMGDQPGPLGARVAKQPLQQLPAQAPPPPVRVDGDPDDGELPDQPVLGGLGPDRLAQLPYQPSEGTSAVGKPWAKPTTWPPSRAAQRRNPASVSSPASPWANQPVSTSASWDGGAAMAAR
jgi:hypothetical protein